MRSSEWVTRWSGVDPNSGGKILQMTVTQLIANCENGLNELTVLRKEDPIVRRIELHEVRLGIEQRGEPMERRRRLGS